MPIDLDVLKSEVNLRSLRSNYGVFFSPAGNTSIILTKMPKVMEDKVQVK